MRSQSTGGTGSGGKGRGKAKTAAYKSKTAPARKVSKGKAYASSTDNVLNAGTGKRTPGSSTVYMTKEQADRAKKAAAKKRGR